MFHRKLVAQAGPDNRGRSWVTIGSRTAGAAGVVVALLVALQPDASSATRALTGPAGLVQTPETTAGTADSSTTSSTLPLVTTPLPTDPEAGVPPMAELESPLFPPPFPVPAFPQLTPEQLAADGRDATGKIVALSRELASVPMESPDLAPLQTDLAARSAERTKQYDLARKADADITTMSADLAATHLLIDRTKLTQQRRTANLAKARALHSQLALDRFVNAKPLDLTIAIVNDTAAQLDRRLTLTEQLLRDSHQTIVDLTAESATAKEQLTKLTERVTTLEQQVRTRSDERDGANGAVATLDGEIAPLSSKVDDARRTAAVVGVDLNGVTLDAYWRASKEALRRGCRLPWQFLAGIGKAETTHGTGTGGHVNAEGQMTKPDVGIPLDGTNNTQSIADSDDGIWDTDPNVERAFGAMQFIPWSWARYRIDGNGDGIRDANNFYDATYAAVGYLCRFSPVTTEAEMYRAAFQYNHSSSYASKVTGYAMSYARTKLPSVKDAEPVVSSAGSDASVTSVPIAAADIGSPEDLTSSSTTAPGTPTSASTSSVTATTAEPTSTTAGSTATTASATTGTTTSTTTTTTTTNTTTSTTTTTTAPPTTPSTSTSVP